MTLAIRRLGQGTARKAEMQFSGEQLAVQEGQLLVVEGYVQTDKFREGGIVSAVS